MGLLKNSLSIENLHFFTPSRLGPESKQEFVLMAKEKGSRGQLVQPERVDKDTPYPMMCKEGKGVRNFACPNYDNCLDKAAKGMWSGFTCRECCSYVQKEEDNQG